MNGEITVNGEATALEAATVAELLAARGVQQRRGVAVAVNGEVVPQPSWDTTRLAAGDRVEIIKVAVGG